MTLTLTEAQHTALVTVLDAVYFGTYASSDALDELVNEYTDEINDVLDLLCEE